MFQIIKNLSTYRRGTFLCSQRGYSTVNVNGPKRRTLLDFKDKYSASLPLTMVTCYDYTSAVIADKVGIDSLLVGDSFSMVMCGNDNTSRATVDEVIYHCKAVSRGAPSSFIVADMPFGSYEINSEDAVRNAIRLIKEGNANAVKLEGGHRMASRVKAIVGAGIPVMGHIGLTPQSLNALGGYKVQGKTAEAAIELTKDAKALEEAGCYSLVIESVPQRISEYITQVLRIPTIGIGAGNKTSGQILVWHDMFGLFQDFTPKFTKQYANIGKLIHEGLSFYKSEVESRAFPAKQHTYVLKQEEWEKFREILNIPKSDGISNQEKISENTVPSPRPGNSEKQIPKFADGKMGQDFIPNTAFILPMEKIIAPNIILTENLSTTANSASTVTGQLETTTPDIPGRQKKKIVVVGGGAMGSLIAARVASNNSNNSPFLCDTWILSSWEEHVNAINQKGLLVEELTDGEKIMRNIRATTSPMEIIRDGICPDLVIILVKTPNTAKAAEKVKTFLSTFTTKTTTILTLQNGIGNLETITSIVGEGLKYRQGVTDLGAQIIGPARVRHTGQGITTIAGDSANDSDTTIRDIFSHGGMNTLMNPDVESVTWGKLVLNAAINPITALLGLENGQLVDGTNSRARSMLTKALMEAVTVARARGISLPYPDPIQKVESVARKTAKNKSSMLVDILRGEQTEIDAINGVIVREGAKLGIDVGMNSFLLKNIKNCVEQSSTF